MKIQDKPVIGRLVFCALASAAVGLGCGDTGSEPRADSAIVDGSPVVDSGKSDTAKQDAPVDVPANADGAIDGVDVNDARQTPDSPDGPVDGTVVDGGIDGGIDGAIVDGGTDSGVDARDASSGDAGALTQAAITFVLKNAGSSPLYLTSQCWTDFKVTSVANGTVYANQSFCMCGCADTSCQGDIQCSPCAPRSGIAVAPGSSRELTWVAQTNSVQKKTGTMGEYSCIAHAPIGTGPYRLSVPVFTTAADATAQTNAKTITADFELGTSSARVEVKLQ